MVSFPPTFVLRHRRENLKKCSLRGLEGRPDLRFLTYPLAVLPPLEGYILLDIEAPLLAPSDASSGILLLDATWRYATRMLQWTREAPGLREAINNNLHDGTNAKAPAVKRSESAQHYEYEADSDRFNPGALALSDHANYCLSLPKSRRLPDHFRTAYPRRQEDCLDPERGLASVEALFLAYWVLGRDGSELLDHYYWKESFLEKNKQFLDR